MYIDVKVNPVYLPYLQNECFIQIYYGGSSSGKSFFLAQRIVIDNLNGVNWLCCRNVAKTIRSSTFNEVSKAISAMGLTKYYSISKSDMVITNRINGKQILFVGLDDSEKVKSITPAVGVLERIFIEEATEIKRDAFKQLTKRLRGRTEHAKCVIMAFNPILKTHWIYSEFFSHWDDSKNSYQEDDLSILKTTFKDNVYLTADDRKQLENESDPYYYNVYSLGNWGVLGHIIFKNWHTEDLSELVPKFDNIRAGMDFGYSSDPNALVKLHIDNKRKRIYIYDEWYQAGMSDEDLLKVSKKIFGREIVTCDSAEPKTIDFLAVNGVNATPAVKGTDSINRGIRFLQGYEIIVDIRCQNMKNELEQYHWQEDKYGNAMAKPVDKNNHLIDALRYAVEQDSISAEVEVSARP